MHILSLVNFWQFPGRRKPGDWRIAGARLTTGGLTVLCSEQDTLYPLLSADSTQEDKQIVWTLTEILLNGT